MAVRCSPNATVARESEGGIAIMVRLAWLALTLLLVMGCSSPSPTQTPTPERNLAVIAGDLSTEAEFGRILDKLQAGTAICAAEPDRAHVADVIVASYDQGGKSGTLLDWARNLASICG